MPDSQENTNTKNKPSQEIFYIKEKLIEMLFWIFSIFMWFALTASVYRTLDLGMQPYNYIQFFLVIIFLFIFFIRNKLTYLVKTWLLLGVLYILATSAVITLGLLSQGMIIMLLFTVLTGILINNKWGLFSFALSLLTIIISAILFLQDISSVDIIALNYSHNISAWFVAILIFAISTWVIIIIRERIVDFLIKKIETSIIHKENIDRVNKMLSKEIESRKTVEHLLKEQYKETISLNKEYQGINQQLQDANKKLVQSNLIINEAKDKAQAADKLKSSFLSNMSHEIRTPLNSIVGFSTLITNENIAPDDKLKYIRLIQSSSNNLLGTISDITNVAKIESGMFTLFPELFDLNTLQDEIIEYFNSEIHIQKKEKIKLVFEKNIPSNCKIITDRESLKQIIYKLIENAIKFTEQGSIKMYCNLQDNGFLNIKIKNTKIGISQKIKKEVYESFRQDDSNNTSKLGGIGIGLSIAKGLIDLLNGTIEFYSTPNQGSEFNVAIPVIIPSQIDNNNTMAADSYKKCTIMIVGKQAWDNLELKQMLQKSNTILIYVETGFQAIDTYKEHPEIRLVITSTKLPNMNAVEFTKILKKASPTLPILAYTAEDKKSFEQNPESYIWNGFIESPLDKKELIKTQSLISKLIKTNLL